MAKKDDINILFRQAQISDKKEIFTFYKKVYSDRENEIIGSRWDWEFENNPFNPDKNKIGIWLAIDSITNKIIGQTGVIYEKFKTAYRDITIGWGVDLVVDAAYRGNHIALNLQKIMLQSVDAYMNISMAYSTRVISEKLGSFELPPVIQFIYPVKVPLERISHYFKLRTFSKESFLNKVIRRLLKNQPINDFLRYSGLLFIISKIWFRSTEEFESDENSLLIRPYNEKTDSQDIDSLWNKYKSQYSNWAQRDFKNFCWKYAEEPLKKHSCFMIVENGISIGYFVLRTGDKIEGNIGLIVDIVIDKNNSKALRKCLAFSKTFFANQEVEFIYVNVSRPELIKEFKAIRFRKTKVHIPTFLTTQKNLKDQIINQNDCFLSFCDHELNRYPVRGK